jgi:hypothetical protein
MCAKTAGGAENLRSFFAAVAKNPAPSGGGGLDYV